MPNSHLRLEARNLGPIEEANLQLRPLTILIGKNNTGKTYLAQALYAVYKSIEEVRPGIDSEFSSEEIRAYASSVLQASGSETLNIPDEVHDTAYEWIRKGFCSAGSELESRMQAYFGLSDLSSVKRWDQQGPVSVDLFQENNDSTNNFLFGLRNETLPELNKLPTVTVDNYESGIVDIASILSDKGNGDEDLHDMHRREYTWMLTTEIWKYYLAHMNLSGSVHYLPAGRSGLLTAWTDVVKLRLQLERDRYGLTKMPDTSLGGIALDFIAALSEILNQRRIRRGRHFQQRLFRVRESQTSDSLQLLQYLMNGGILAGAGQDMVPTLEYSQGNHKIPIQRASSMVADHAPLAMWVQHLLRPDDLLIIDEPESHLHPEAIRLVARVLVRLVNENINIVCATHSSVLLHEISNCILRQKILERGNKDLGDGYLASDCIDAEDVAVHRFFRPEHNGSVVASRIKVDNEWGIPEDEYVEVASELADESNRLFEEFSR